MVIEIPLSKTGKHAGKYVAIVDDCDADFVLLFNWNILISKRNNTLYARTTKNEYLHRVILERVLGYALSSKCVVDHIDGNGLNCQRANLRIATYQESAQNRRVRSDSKTQIKGVSCEGLKFRACIWVKGKRFNLGLYDTLDGAKNAYDTKAREIFGEFSSSESRIDKS